MTHTPPLPPTGPPVTGISAPAGSESDLAALNELLRARLFELESSNACLREALRSSEELREVAERANRSKDEFIATISHELRTPLNTIRLWSQMLAEGKLSAEDVVKGARILERSALAQQQLVEDLLDVSRISRGQLRLELRNGQLIEAVEAAVTHTRPLAQARGVQLAADLAGGTHPVRADADRIQQVASNLLTNAVKFTPECGQIHVGIAVEDGSAIVRVRDTGIGIPAAEQEHLFGRFFRASNARDIPGTGLGLAIVHGIVTSHGGDISVSSEEGKGCTFTVRLPCTVTGWPEAPR